MALAFRSVDTAVPPGTCRELIARQTHTLSPLSTRPRSQPELPTSGREGAHLLPGRHLHFLALFPCLWGLPCWLLGIGPDPGRAETRHSRGPSTCSDRPSGVEKRVCHLRGELSDENLSQGWSNRSRRCSHSRPLRPVGLVPTDAKLNSQTGAPTTTRSPAGAKGARSACLAQNGLLTVPGAALAVKLLHLPASRQGSFP